MAETLHTEEKKLISNTYGIPRTIAGETVNAIIQAFPAGTCSVIYFGDLDPTQDFAMIGQDSDVFIRIGTEDPGMVYQRQSGVWNPMVNITGPVGPTGADGHTPYIDPETGHWMLNGIDTGVIGEGHDGKDGAPGEPGPTGAPGATPTIDPDTGNWKIGEIDTGVYAHGTDGKTPYINEDNRHWMIGDIDTEVPANGLDGITPSIDPITKHWMIGETDTGIIAEGKDGVNGVNGNDGIDGTPGKDGESPYIGPDGNWYVGEMNTGTQAQGLRGLTGERGPAGADAPIPYINDLGNWQVGENDTGIKAQGPQGTPGTNGADGIPGEPGTDGAPGLDGKDGDTPSIDPETGNWMVGELDTGIHAQGPAGKDGKNGVDGLTPQIDPESKHWTVGGIDTGIMAEGHCTCEKYSDMEVSSYIAEILELGVDPDMPYGDDMTVLFTGGTESALGKTITDFIDEESLNISPDGSVTNNFKYVKEFTEFSDVEEEQSGHFIVLKLTGKPGQSITMTGPSGRQFSPAAGGWDDTWVVRLTNKQDSTISFTVDGKPYGELNFSGSTFAEETD